MAQTAVEWLEARVAERINNNQMESPYWHLKQFIKDFEAAKQMEKEQRINAQMDMFNRMDKSYYGLDYLNRRDAALKYAEDYTTRLQNETN